MEGGYEKSMSFEIRARDLMGRIGILETKSGKVTTPSLFPVINPIRLTLHPSFIEKKMKCKTLITNAMITLKHASNEAREKGIHRFLEFNGVVMTDSGAYQLMTYGNIEASQLEIIRFQEEIGSDIAVILDIPSGGARKKQEAEECVNRTLLNAKESLSQRERRDVLWVGPVQGSPYPDLVERCAAEVGRMDFDVYAIGSVVTLMENYNFDLLVDVVMAAKRNIPLDKPVHLFGAGHPMMFALITAMGVDTFDSAAYALYAKDERYMMPYGTQRLSELEYFPCSCPVCLEYTPKELLKESEEERERKLAIHNLYVSLSEVHAVRQAILDGRLWELLEVKARSHPSLLRGLKRLSEYSRYITKFVPMVKKRAILFCGPESLNRPEVVRHLEKVEKTPQPVEVEVLVILPEVKTRPFYRSKERRILERAVGKLAEEERRKIQFAMKSSLFGVIPEELEEVYPLSQHLTISGENYVKEHIVNAICKLIRSHEYKLIFFPLEGENISSLEKACHEKGAELRVTSLPEGRKKWEKIGEIIRELINLRNAVTKES